MLLSRHWVVQTRQRTLAVMKTVVPLLIALTTTLPWHPNDSVTVPSPSHDDHQAPPDRGTRADAGRESAGVCCFWRRLRGRSIERDYSANHRIGSAPDPSRWIVAAGCSHAAAHRRWRNDPDDLPRGSPCVDGRQ